MALTKLNLYCLCGAAWRGVLPPMTARRMKALWRVEHSGLGHGPCDARMAARARAKAETRA